jgi:hypothetical protein
VDEHTSQIDVAALADAEQLLFASGRVLPWHDTNPSCEIASSAKSCSVTDGGHVAVETSGPKPRIWSRRRQSAFSWLMRSIFSVIALTYLELFPLLPQTL